MPVDLGVGPLLLTAVARVVSSLTGQARSLTDRLPQQVRRELADTVGRLTAARSPQQFAVALEAELARLLATVLPVLGRTPVPARSPATARLMVAGVAGTAGAMQSVDELAALLGGSVVSVPTAVGSLVVAWTIEVWAAVAVRTRQLEQAGRRPDRARLSAEVAEAVMGTASPIVPRYLAVWMGRGASKRFTRRWTVGLVPVVGAVYDAFDAQSTISVITRFPVEDHPPAD